MSQINPQRLLADLHRLRSIGAYRTGVHRPTFSSEDMEGRRWLAAQYEAAGLNALIDGVGNVFGRAPEAGPRLLIGSHAESQNHAGWLDGALGVIYGLELARTFRESPHCTGLQIEPVAWADEESHFIPFLGTRSFIGDMNDEEIDAARDRTTGRPLRTAIAEAGLEGVPRELADPKRYVGYLEAHIEQGDSLEAAGLSLGVVTSIVGIQQYRIVFSGTQNHAGTTRMAIRRDAGRSLVTFCTALDRTFDALKAERTVWTVGRITLEPGAPAIIPGRAEMLFQFRDDDTAVIARLDAALHDLVAETDAAGPCGVTIETLSESRPSRMEPAFQAALTRAAEQCAPGRHVAMPSGAGHDAQILARFMPCGMLFVPSIGGISHHWTEDTREDDIVLGCQVLADAAEIILGAAHR